MPAKTLIRLLLSTIFCSLFYLFGIYSSTTTTTTTTALSSCLELDPPHNTTYPPGSLPSLDFSAHHFAPLPPEPPSHKGHRRHFSFCPKNFTNYCPCHDPSRERLFSFKRSFHRERHCPDGNHEKLRCLVEPPPGYRDPFPWPKSREMAWFRNVPFKRLTIAKKSQNWVQIKGDRLVFPGGGTSFPMGVKGYIDEIRQAVPLKSGSIRTVLDVGCGVASFGAGLLDYNILTMSIAPRDIHEAQVQFALERGLPAMLGVLSTYRLPYPSRSFDMAHCSRCLVQWTDYDGLYLIEIDRVLRPGGYWVLSGPPINWKGNYKGWKRPAEDLKNEQNVLEDLATRLCWKKISEIGNVAVWRKPTNHIHCMKKLKAWKSHSFCGENDPDAAWYRKMDPCITPLPMVKNIKDISGGALEKWPSRLNSIPPRIMHTPGAALSPYPVWVMNVAPFDAKNDTLGIVYERGLIGSYMNWCEAFSTYPRTYDMIHADGVFSMYMSKCDILDILFEMHRILRPHGAVIVRDHVDVIHKVKDMMEGMGWNVTLTHSERGPFHPEKILYVDNSQSQVV
ncbi:hypothetical protein Dimus_029965 [Dionaea muscipula]